MTREEVDSDSFEGSIAGSGSQTLEVQAGRASELVIYVDDGTTGGAPASYSLDIDSQHDEFSDYHRQENIAAGTGLYHEAPSNGSTMRVTVTDESTNSVNRRVLVKSYRSMD